MLRDIKRVADRVPVPPTMAARRTAPEPRGNPDLARSARQDASPDRGRDATANVSDTSKPTRPTATDKPAKAPRPVSGKQATMAPPPAAPFRPPADTRPGVGIELASIAAALVAVIAGWWLISNEIVDRAETRIPPATRAGGDLAQIRQELQQERDNAEKLSAQLAQARQELRSQAVASADKAALEQDLADLRQALQKEHDNAEKLGGQLADARQELRSQAVASADKAALDKELTDLRQVLQQERDNAEKLGGQLAQARQELRSQALALAEKAAQNQELTDLRQALHRKAMQSESYQELLAQERARTQGLEEKLSARQDSSLGRGSNEAANPSDAPRPLQATTTDMPVPTPPLMGDRPAVAAGEKPATTQLLMTDKPTVAADDKPARMAALPTASQGPDNPEAPRLMARARLLLSQGNIAAARIVLERAVDTGSAPALLALAETYDPAILSAWGTVGTQGDVAKARDLYAKALAGGIHEAKDRLNVLP